MLRDINVKDIIAIAQEAGKVIMEIYKKDFKIEYKEDKSPLTEADIKANEIICMKLLELYPNIPIISEESKQIEYAVRKNWEYYWCIDPIDGTKEFIKKSDEFTVNIALIHKNTPLLGVVYAPALDEIYSAKKNEGAFKNGERLPLKLNRDQKKNITVVASRSHLSDETKKYIDNATRESEDVTLIFKGSSLKLCMVAAGEADIYPRLAPTMEWDIAAADAIVRESKKMTYQLKNQEPIKYNKENLLNPWFVVR